MRDNTDLQFTPLPPIAKTQHNTPAWLEWLMRQLESLFAPIGRLIEAIFAPLARLLGMSWPAFKWLLIGLAALLAAFILWQIARGIFERRRKGGAPEADVWTPDQAEAEALLSDAEKLAAEGRFAEAVHLLLRRSVQQIARSRPQWIAPANTAREIAALPMLPEGGRRAFGEIARRVERSRYALRNLNDDDWQAARAAYADFARVGLPS